MGKRVVDMKKVVNSTMSMYDRWMAEVNSHLLRRIGCTADDLCDYCYADDFQSGVQPASAASRAIRYTRGLD